MKIKVGFGFDVHQLAEGEELILGGVKFEHYKGTVAHSDGDVLIHAICDALLGAANLGDIGFHFPPSSDEFKGISSVILLERTVKLITEKGYSISNIDCTVCLQKPKILKFVPEMKVKLSEATKISIDDISIKATTTEKLGYVGREEGISSYATVLLIK